MNVDTSLAAFIVLGVAYAALPGVVNTEAIRRGMHGGFKAALLVQVGALIGDATWAVVALAGASVLLRNDTFGLALGILGAGFLFHLARKALGECLAWQSSGGCAGAGRPEPDDGSCFLVGQSGGAGVLDGNGGRHPGDER